jgi:precorrin-6B methylase 2
MLAAVLVVALLVARTCGATTTEITKEQATEIAQATVTSFEPNNVMVRLIKRGLASEEFWAVSLSTKLADGTLENIHVVVIDGQTGDVVEIRREG